MNDDEFSRLVAAQAAFEEVEDAIVRDLAAHVMTDLTTKDFKRSLALHLIDESVPIEMRTHQARAALALVYGVIVTGTDTNLWQAAGNRLFSLAATVVRFDP